MSYTRTMGVPQMGADPVQPRFHIEAIIDEVASESAGHPVYREQERVQYMMVGPNSPVFVVTDEHRQRWPKQYEAFRNGVEISPDGTPLEQWAYLRKAHVLTLKQHGIHTVEQCAGLSDTQCQTVGMGAQAIRANARAYLDDSAATAIVSESLARAERAESKTASLERQVEELRAIVDRLHAETMTARDAPPAPSTYVPPDNARAAVPQQGAALGELPMPRPRGRPRADQEAA